MNEAPAAPVRATVGRRLLATSFLWSLAGDLSSKAAVFLATFIAVRALAPAGFAQYVGLSAVGILAAAMWDMGGSALLTREFAAGRLSKRLAVRQIVHLRMLSFPLWLGTFAIGFAIIAIDDEVPVLTMFAFACASLVYSCHMMLMALLRASLRFRAASLAIASGRWVTAAFSLIALTQFGDRQALAIVALAFLVGELFTLALAVFEVVRIRDAPHLRKVTEETRLTARAAMPFAANALLATAYNRFDVIIVAALATSVQLQNYVPASRLQDAFYLVPSSLGAIALPLISQMHEQSADPRSVSDFTRKLIIIGVAITLPIALISSMFMPHILRIVLGSSYDGASDPARILVWSMPLAAIGAPLVAALAGIGRAADTTKAFATAFMVALLLHVSLDWWLGAIGAATASLSRDIANVGICLLLYRSNMIRRARDNRTGAEIAGVIRTNSHA